MFNLGGSLALVHEFAAAIADAVPGSAGLIDFEDQPLPFPEDISADELQILGPIPVTPLQQGVRATADFFQDLKTRGKLDPGEHGLEPVPSAQPALVNG